MKFKVLSSFLSASMFLSVIPVFSETTTFAEETPEKVESVNIQALEAYHEFKVTPDKMIYSEEMAAIKPASEEEIQARIDRLAEEFNSKLSAKDQQKGQDLYRSYTKIYGNSIKSQSVVDYDKFYNELRKANYIETILDLNEGLTEFQIAKIGITHANKARDLALNKYPASNSCHAKRRLSAFWLELLIH
ncbi:hypothetical protein E6C60_1692 [Paenibacillus algicola]|uniref:Uncharacterized protein n=1 Tax=Paenibacillus algicola TaxID=2565926 RepID=A0A4P8XIH8_9BACL|nr:hypothetical protein [Paenibacillus algicola]QCT02407.1 hypothetical protein E6C60_1692 [Paenibacillus algicola]